MILRRLFALVTAVAMLSWSVTPAMAQFAPNTLGAEVLHGQTRQSAADSAARYLRAYPAPSG